MVECIGNFGRQRKPVFDIDAYNTEPDISAIWACTPLCVIGRKLDDDSGGWPSRWVRRNRPARQCLALRVTTPLGHAMSSHCRPVGPAPEEPAGPVRRLRQWCRLRTWCRLFILRSRCSQSWRRPGLPPQGAACG
jgi:hypothetical protein